jgi:hypothetical protein
VQKKDSFLMVLWPAAMFHGPMASEVECANKRAGIAMAIGHHFLESFSYVNSNLPGVGI